MQVQLKYNEFKKTQKKVKNKIIFVLENLEHFENIGSAFRIADSFNIEQVFIIWKEMQTNRVWLMLLRKIQRAKRRRKIA